MSGTYLLEFRVFDALSGGSVIWRESQYVPVREGSFSTELGRAAPLPDRLLSDPHRVAVGAPYGLPWRPILAIAKLRMPPEGEERHESARQPAAQIPVSAEVAEELGVAETALVRAKAAAAAAAWDIRKERRPSDEKMRRLERDVEQFKRVAERSKQEAEESKGRLDALEKAVREKREENSVRIYDVQPGDTLRSIAVKLYGDADRWVDLYEANHDRLQRGGDPVAGQRLVAPRAK
jgi:nucleoid-associated protein YgaU